MDNVTGRKGWGKTKVVRFDKGLGKTGSEKADTSPEYELAKELLTGEFNNVAPNTYFYVTKEQIQELVEIIKQQQKETPSLDAVVNSKAVNDYLTKLSHPDHGTRRMPRQQNEKPTIIEGKEAEENMLRAIEKKRNKLMAQGGEIVGQFYLDTRKDKNFQVVSKDAGKIGIQYYGKDKTPVGGIEHVAENDFEYNVSQGAWNQWRQPYIEKKTPSRDEVVALLHKELGEFKLMNNADNYIQIDIAGGIREFQIDLSKRCWYEFKQGGRSDSPTETFVRNITPPLFSAGGSTENEGLGYSFTGKFYLRSNTDYVRSERKFGVDLSGNHGGSQLGFTIDNVYIKEGEEKGEEVTEVEIDGTFNAPDTTWSEDDLINQLTDEIAVPIESYTKKYPQNFDLNVSQAKYEGGGEIETPQVLGFELKQFFKKKYGIEIRTRYIKTVRGLDNSWYEISTFRTGGDIIPNEVRKEILEISSGKMLAELKVQDPDDISYGNVRDKMISALGKAWKIFLTRHKTEYADGGEIWKHKHMDATAEIISETGKGYKVKFTDNTGKKLKIITQFFDRQDFHGDKAIFVKQPKARTLEMVQKELAELETEKLKYQAGLERSEEEHKTRWRQDEIDSYKTLLQQTQSKISALELESQHYGEGGSVLPEIDIDKELKNLKKHPEDLFVPVKIFKTNKQIAQSLYKTGKNYMRFGEGGSVSVVELMSEDFMLGDTKAVGEFEEDTEVFDIHLLSKMLTLLNKNKIPFVAERVPANSKELAHWVILVLSEDKPNVQKTFEPLMKKDENDFEQSQQLAQMKDGGNLQSHSVFIGFDGDNIKWIAYGVDEQNKQELVGGAFEVTATDKEFNDRLITKENAEEYIQRDYGMKRGGNMSRDKTFLSKEVWEQDYFPYRIGRAKHYRHFVKGGQVGNALSFFKSLDLTKLPTQVAEHIKSLMEHPEIGLLEETDADFVELKQYIEQKFADAIKKAEPKKQKKETPAPTKKEKLSAKALPVVEVETEAEGTTASVSVLRTRIKLIKKMIASGDKTPTLKTRIKIIQGMIAEQESGKVKHPASAKVEITDVAAVQTAIAEVVDRLADVDEKDRSAMLHFERIKKLLDAGYTKPEIVTIMVGYGTVHKIQCDGEFVETSRPSGITKLQADYQDEAIKEYVEAAEKNAFELGLKYPEFNWSGIIKKYKIDLTPKIISVRKSGDYTYEYEVFVGKNIAIGHTLRTKKDEDAVWREYKSAADGKFNNDYWGVVSSSKSVIEDVAATLVAQTSGYVKDLEIYVNGLGGISERELAGHLIAYAKGGAILRLAKGGLAGLSAIDFKLDEDYNYVGVIANELRKHGIDAQASFFDKYQGAYIFVSGKGKFWVEDMFYSGIKKTIAAGQPKYLKAIMTDDDGQWSANRGDYFDRPKNFVFKGTKLHLTDLEGKTTTIENPKVSDLPDLLEIQSTFQYQKGSETAHIIFYPESDPETKITVIENQGEYNVSEFAEYLGVSFGKGGALKGAKVLYRYQPFKGIKGEDQTYTEYIVKEKDGKHTLTSSSFGRDFDEGFEKLNDLLSFHGIKQKMLQDVSELKFATGGSVGGKTWEVSYKIPYGDGKTHKLEIPLGILSEERDVINAIARKRTGGWEGQVEKIELKSTTKETLPTGKVKIVPYNYTGFEYPSQLVWVDTKYKHPDPLKKMIWGKGLKGGKHGETVSDFKGFFTQEGKGVELEYIIPRYTTHNQEMTIRNNAIREYLAAVEKRADGGMAGSIKTGDLVFCKNEGSRGMVGLVTNDQHKEEGTGIEGHDIYFRGYNGDTFFVPSDEMEDIVNGHLSVAENNGDLIHYPKIAEKEGIKLNPKYEEALNYRWNDEEFKNGGNIFGKLQAGAGSLFAKGKEVYGKSKTAVQKQLHDKQKEIAWNVIQDTRGIVASKKDSILLNEASNLVEEYFEAGGKLPKYSDSKEGFYKKNNTVHIMWHGARTKAKVIEHLPQQVEGGGYRHAYMLKVEGVKEPQRFFQDAFLLSDEDVAHVKPEWDKMMEFLSATGNKIAKNKIEATIEKLNKVLLADPTNTDQGDWLTMNNIKKVSLDNTQGVENYHFEYGDGDTAWFPTANLSDYEITNEEMEALVNHFKKTDYTIVPNLDRDTQKDYKYSVVTREGKTVGKFAFSADAENWIKSRYAAGGKAGKVKTIEDATDLMPEVIAETVARNVILGKWEDKLGVGNIKQEHDAEISTELANWVEFLSTKAEGLFQHNADFKKKISADGNVGRDTLYMYMNHWMGVQEGVFRGAEGKKPMYAEADRTLKRWLDKGKKFVEGGETSVRKWNVKDAVFLIDQLTNSMEHYQSKEEFAEHINKETGMSKSKLEKIFDDYWKLGAKERFENDIDEWVDFIEDYDLDKPEAIYIYDGKEFTAQELINFADVALHYDRMDNTEEGDPARTRELTLAEAIMGLGGEEEVQVKKMAHGGKISESEFEEVLNNYIVAALWSSTDSGNDDAPLDRDYSAQDLAPETLAKMRSNVEKFLTDNAEAIKESGIEPAQLGQSLWLTQNHHGAGFFDLMLDSDVEEKLIKGAHALGEHDLYVGDDKKIYKGGGKVKHSYQPYNGNYLTLIPSEKGVTIKITDEGREYVKDDLDGKLTEQNFLDLFESIRNNSEYNYFPDAGDANFALASCPVITDGYYYDDSGKFTDKGHKDSRVFAFMDYAVKDFTEELLEKGEVFFPSGDESPDHSHKKSDGGKADDGLWIQSAIKHKGSLRKKAKALHLIKGDEKLSEADYEKLEKLGKSWKKKVELAKRLVSFHAAGGKVEEENEGTASSPKVKTIEGVKHHKANEFRHVSGMKKLEGLDSGHPLGDAYIKGKSGYVQNGYDWYKFNLERWKNRKAKK